MGKIPRRFSIDDKLYQKFEDICKRKKINKSIILRDAIKKFITDNYDIDRNQTYKIKNSINEDYVTITGKDAGYLILSNGNRIDINDFELIYEAEDLKVRACLDFFEKKEEIEEADEVYVLDFTFIDMGTLAEITGQKLIWIDHHKTAMEENKELWDSNILGKRDITKAASQLTWEYLRSSHPLPTAVEYISKRDVWQFGDKKEVISAFTGACQILLHSPEDADWKDLLASCDNKNEKVELYLRVGHALTDVRKVRIEKAFERGIDINFHGLKARLINTTTDASALGEYVYQKPE